MGTVQATASARGPIRAERRRGSHGALAVFGLALLLAACQSLTPLDTTPLDNAGMSYSSIKQLKELHVTSAEVGELTKVRQAGLSDSDCVELLQIFHNRDETFNAGDAVAALHQSGISEGVLLALAGMDEVGLGYGDLQAMHLAGLSDAIVLEVARHHATGMPVLSGASLGTMRNLRMDNDTLLELVRRGIPDSQAPEILALRRHGASDAEILRRFAAN
ncbi:MAG: hypothetical protein WA192_01270 [Candidatus Acidiferrales bacterium]